MLANSRPAWILPVTTSQAPTAMISTWMACRRPREMLLMKLASSLATELRSMVVCRKPRQRAARGSVRPMARTTSLFFRAWSVKP